MPKKIMYILLVSSIILCITGCGLFKKQVEEREPQLSEEETEQVRTDIRKTVLYFVNEYKMLVPLTRDIPRVEGIGKAAVECLIDNPDSRMSLVEKGLKPPLPEGTRVVGLNIRDGLAKIDFSSGFLNCNDVTAEENAISAVVYTLTEFPAVEQVSIMIEGKPLEKSLHGSVVKEVLQRENINPEPTKSSLKLNDMMPVTLYFKGSSTDGTYNYFVPSTSIINPQGLPAHTTAFSSTKEEPCVACVSFTQPKSKL
jgi:germination protein M